MNDHDDGLNALRRAIWTVLLIVAIVAVVSVVVAATVGVR